MFCAVRYRTRIAGCSAFVAVITKGHSEQEFNEFRGVAGFSLENIEDRSVLNQ